MMDMSVNTIQTLKTATHLRGHEVGDPLRKAHSPLHHSTDKKNIFFYVQFELGSSILLTRKLMPNKKGTFSWRMFSALLVKNNIGV